MLRQPAAGNGQQAEASLFLELHARTLLNRYGVVFHRLLARESIRVPWRDLLMIFRRLEARGEIRGGRFLAGVTGEQFALPEAVARIRAIRRRDDQPGQMITISAADPLNLIGIVTPGDRIASIASTRILFEDGVPLAVLEAGRVRPLATYPVEREAEIAARLARSGSRLTARNLPSTPAVSARPRLG